jgi:hypothetical protein
VTPADPEDSAGEVPGVSHPRAPLSVRSALGRLDPAARGDAWRAFAGSRALVLGAAALGATIFPFGEASHAAYPTIVHPFESWPLGDLLDFLFSPFIRGDAGWYLRIATEGYDPAGIGGVGASGRPAFFPVYPALLAGLGGFADLGAGVLAGCAISLLSLLGALYILHRLVTLELGPRIARATVLLVAFSPTAYFFSAPYTESLFLLESVGALYCARRGRWMAAGVLGALASGTRNLGVLLVVPLLLLYLYEDRRIGSPAELRRSGLGVLAPRRRLRSSILWLGLTPLGLVAYSLYLRADLGDAQAWRHAQAFFGRPDVVDPIEGIRRGTEAAIDALQGTAPDAFQFPIVLSFCFLVFAGVALVGVVRELPVAYGAYSLSLLLPPLCAPAVENPLGGFPRYALVAFPLFMWLGIVCERRRVTGGVVFAFGALLAILTAGFASHQELT